MVSEADLLIVGGGIHGCGIARDAAGRGLRVVLAEQADLASGTSSASSKLIHGGLRYLEQLEFRLVREALAEREVLLRAAPHIVHPLRFVMPHAKTLRPAWMIRAGLLLYDWLARRDTLPRSESLVFSRGALAGVLKPTYLRGYAYSDCQVDDARLVVANAIAAAEHGARIFTRTKCVGLERDRTVWRARFECAGADAIDVQAHVLVNAAGPSARAFLTGTAGVTTGPQLKPVQGSHIVVPRLYTEPVAFILQNDDGRVVFVCPYGEHSLIGTTDVPRVDDGPCSVTAQEISYLCRASNRYFARQIAPADVVWSYCGVRGLVDDGTADPARVTRDYVLHVDAADGFAPVLSVFGGKLTTYRRLAERALEKLAPWLPVMGRAWTAKALLPGGDAGGDVAEEIRALAATYAQLPGHLVHALWLRHGSRTGEVLRNAKTAEDLGESFGANLYAREIDYMIEREWVRTGEDVLWRRTKAGLHLAPQEQARVEEYVTGRARAL